MNDERSGAGDGDRSWINKIALLFSSEPHNRNDLEQVLQLAAEKNQGNFTINARADHDIILLVVATTDDEKIVGEIALKAGNHWNSLSLPLAENDAWQGVITELELRLRGPLGTLVEFDSISIP